MLLAGGFFSLSGTFRLPSLVLVFSLDPRPCMHEHRTVVPNEEGFFFLPFTLFEIMIKCLDQNKLFTELLNFSC